MKKSCIAMLLAGGQGSRLGILTREVAKPAVPFGGKYRIIDFPLSNCTNSEIDTVGVLTQYQPLALNSYIAGGQPWDLDRVHGGVFVLPPYIRGKTGEWYKGTANAIYQNISFIEQFDPDHVLVLSGDHIYKMDYSKMLGFHQAHGAAATIAVIEVPWEEAGRFGIMNTGEDHEIVEFQEKPKEPLSNKASMGVYIFTWKVLKRYLLEDESDPGSSNDFGKDVIPKMLANRERLFAFPFMGYWKDVGTVESLWEANMDLLGNPPRFDLFEPGWRIYARNTGQPPHYIAPYAQVIDSMINEGCRVHGRVQHSVLFTGVTIEEGAEVRDCVILPGARVRRGARAYSAILADGVELSEGSLIGSGEGEGITVIGAGTRIPAGISVVKGTMLDAQSVLSEAGKGGIRL